jgi:hypothetical protein
MLTHPNPLADAATTEADDRPLVHLVQSGSKGALELLLTASAGLQHRSSNGLLASGCCRCHTGNPRQSAHYIVHVPWRERISNWLYRLAVNHLLNMKRGRAKIGCTSGMLLCLEREQRLVSVLGEIFGVTDRLGAELLDISRDSFRQKLTRHRATHATSCRANAGL